ncbi:MAG: B12-binding domain-containing protein [Planctomycetota bacterium]
MLPLDRQFAESIDGVSRALAEWSLSLLYERRADFDARYGPEGRDLWKGEFVNRLQYLAEAVAADRPTLFVHSVEWARAAFAARDLDERDLIDSLEALDETLKAELPAQVSARACRIVSAGLAALRKPVASAVDAAAPSVLDHEGVDGTRARLYLMHLLERHQSKAVDVLLEAVRSGKTVAQVYETVIGPALSEVGRLWHLKEATVADEHYVTAATQSAMAVLRMKLPRAEPNGSRVLAASVGGDLHDIGIRMVADLLESEGFEVECLGANMPTLDLIDRLRETAAAGGFDLIALSASTGLTVRAMTDAVAAIRAESGPDGPPIMVGGGAFCSIPDLWQVVGADGCACSATEAVKVAKRLVG